MSKAYVDRNPNKSGSLYENIYTGSKSSIEEILTKLRESTTFKNDPEIQGLIQEICLLYHNGMFDDNYDNIAHVAPELQIDFIYKEFAHIGQSTTEKNIGGMGDWREGSRFGCETVDSRATSAEV